MLMCRAHTYDNEHQSIRIFITPNGDIDLYFEVENSGKVMIMLLMIDADIF